MSKQSLLENFLNLDRLKKWGISEWGVTHESRPLSYHNFQQYLNDEKHLPLSYLSGERGAIREDIKNYFSEFQSAVVFLFPYGQSHVYLKNIYKNRSADHQLKIASYTFGFEGKDYHEVLKNRLEDIACELKTLVPELKYKISLDVHPVLERDLAYRAIPGFIGKNSMFITRHSGSMFIIAALLTNINWEIEEIVADGNHCGQCTRCADQCPTAAIDIKTRTILANNCISTFTIEQFKMDAIPALKMNLESGYIFGCDICQDVCPWNQKIERKLKNDFDQFELSSAQKKLLDFFILDSALKVKTKLEMFSNKTFLEFFARTSFSRSGKKGLLKNIIFYLNRFLS